MPAQDLRTDAKLSTSEASTAFPFSAEARDGRPITPLWVYSPIPVVRRWRLSSAAQSAWPGSRRGLVGVRVKKDGSLELAGVHVLVI